MKNITIVGLRLLAIWILIEALGYLQFLPAYFINQYNNIDGLTLGVLIVFLLYLSAACILMFMAPTLANKITAGIENKTFEIANYEKLAAILFASVGLLILVNSFGSLLHSIGAIYSKRTIHSLNNTQFLKTVRSLLLGGGIQMIIGLWLFFGSKKLARWWYNFRNWT